MRNKIKFIYFDFGGVFFNWDNYFKNASDAFGFDRQQIIKYFNKNSEAITKGHISSQKFWEMFQEEVGIKNAKNFDFTKSWANDYVPIPAMHRFAKSLHKKYKVGVISNIYKGMYPFMVKNGKVPDSIFSVEILSCEVRLQKPEREIFELAQQKAGFAGDEILFIDDSKEYLDGAKQLGWQTFHFETHNADTSIAGIKNLLV